VSTVPTQSSARKGEVSRAKNCSHIANRQGTPHVASYIAADNDIRVDKLKDVSQHNLLLASMPQLVRGAPLGITCTPSRVRGPWTSGRPRCCVARQDMVGARLRRLCTVRPLGSVRGFLRRTAVEEAVDIHVVNDVDLVAAAHEGMRETTHILSVTAQTVWRIKRRDHRDAQGPICIVSAGHGTCRFVVSALAWADDKSARSRKGALNT